MKMKKVLAFGLSAAMVFSLAACSGGGNGEPQAAASQPAGTQSSQAQAPAQGDTSVAAQEITLWTYPI